MKYLENLPLENLTKAITKRELGGGLIINGRVEAYSTKKAADEKKQSKILESKFADSISTVNGDNSPKKTEKILVDLIQTMNCSMVDYDFSELTPASFAQTSINDAVQTINSHLAEITAIVPNFINDMWKAICDPMGNLAQCEVYKLTDNTILDDEDNETVWSFNYFFCSKELKRVCYFTCLANSKYRKMDMLGYGGDDSDEDGDGNDNEPMDTSDGERGESDEEEENNSNWD